MDTPLSKTCDSHAVVQCPKETPTLENYEIFRSFSKTTDQGVSIKATGLIEHGQPLVSIITIVFNGEATLERTILSVLNQSYCNLEYIIVDGGSTDRTLEIIQKYKERISYWISEPDQGVSDAFNRGVTLANGSIIGIINSDDWYEPQAVAKAVNEFHTTDTDIVCGSISYWYSSEEIELFYPDLDNLVVDSTLPHPAVFSKKEVYSIIGLFNLSYLTAMDYEWLLRAKVNGFKFSSINDCLANMSGGGLSVKFQADATKESLRAKLFYFPEKRSISYLYYYFQITKSILKNVFEKLHLKILIKLYRKKFSVMKKEQL
jgi:glycosyltransferase involved in cell wall biosynthesis